MRVSGLAAMAMVVAGAVLMPATASAAVFTLHGVPEPASIALFGFTAIVGGNLMRRRPTAR